MKDPYPGTIEPWKTALNPRRGCFVSWEAVEEFEKLSDEWYKRRDWKLRYPKLAFILDYIILRPTGWIVTCICIWVFYGWNSLWESPPKPKPKKKLRKKVIVIKHYS